MQIFSKEKSGSIKKMNNIKLCIDSGKKRF